MDDSRTLVHDPPSQIHPSTNIATTVLTISRPDNCDGSYQQYCDSSREYSNITSILQSQGRNELLAYMQNYWTDIGGDEESFWEHEWNKHGTCLNTIVPRCYVDYTSQEEVGDFFQRTVGLFKGLDTYQVCFVFHMPAQPRGSAC